MVVLCRIHEVLPEQHEKWETESGEDFMAPPTHETLVPDEENSLGVAHTYKTLHSFKCTRQNTRNGFSSSNEEMKGSD